MSAHKANKAFKEFINGTLELWNNYLEWINEYLTKRIPTGEKGQLLFPSLALFTETDNHYIFELLGANSSFRGLECHQHTFPSTISYFGQFEEATEPKEEESILDFAGRGGAVRNYLIQNGTNSEALKNRLGFIADQWPSQIERPEKKGPFLYFRSTFQSCFIDNCLFINSFNGKNRMKYIAYSEIISKSFSFKLYYDDLLVRLGVRIFDDNDLYGVKYFRDLREENFAIASQFANVFLIPNLRETTIGKFLQRNPDYIKTVFECKDFIYEPLFEWKEGPHKPDEKYINPDLMLERENSYYDICDLKTALTDKKKITRAKHARRRFIDKVDDGIAQLANYEEFFDSTRYPKNAEQALIDHNVRVKDPKLILVIGNHENSIKEEVREASRPFKNNYVILDYDALNTLYLVNSRANNISPETPLDKTS